MRTGSALLCIVTALSPAVAVAGPTAADAARPAAVSPSTSETRQLITLAGIVEQRIALADIVAEAKWPTRGPVDDPAREKVVLDAAAAGAVERGLDPDSARVFFRDQIEASKVVQYGLFSHWGAVPADEPTEVPDLSKIRPILDQITGRLLDTLKATQPIRSGPYCRAFAGIAKLEVEQSKHLDSLHRAALGRGLRSVCE
ncbi:MAG TPA: chorismate mutase [Mycobacteriales bacterium]|nr:chorismate mutase [Mycobacteriales bacterium]